MNTSIDLIPCSKTNRPPVMRTYTIEQAVKALQDAYKPLLKFAVGKGIKGDPIAFERFERQRDDAIRFLRTYERELKKPWTKAMIDGVSSNE